MKRILMLLLGAGCLTTAGAQIRLGDGQLSGSFETNTIFYVNDHGMGDAGKAPDDHFGSNNYLKVDYNYGRFSAGLQVDAYLPALQGFELGQQPDYHKFYLSSKYIQWQDRNFSVLVGDIFDQFGNGLIFRSYEDRQLGMNNALEGFRGQYRFGRYVEVTGMYGRPRLYTDYADSWVRGADVKVSLADIFDFSALRLSIEGSYVNRYENIGEDFAELGLTTPNLNMYSGRLNADYKGFTFRGEYVHKSKDLAAANAFEAVKGYAALGEIGYSYKGFSFSGQVRALDNMGTLLTLYGSGTGNTLNYLPALTRQYTYSLANLNPYQVNVLGELGGQVDLYYTLRNPQTRSKYWNFHANFSTFYTLHDANADGRQMLWRDVNFDVERQWNRQWKSTFLFSRQEWEHNGLITSNIFVADVTWRINRKSSLRGELQYLLSDDYEGDWIAAGLEYSLAPRWSFFVNEMTNLDVTETTYYSGGFSYSRNRTRVQISYGRNRAGYICSGGVCRYSPAYTGVNVQLTSSF